MQRPFEVAMTRNQALLNPSADRGPAIFVTDVAPVTPELAFTRVGVGYGHRISIPKWTAYSYPHPYEHQIRCCHRPISKHPVTFPVWGAEARGAIPHLAVDVGRIERLGKDRLQREVARRHVIRTDGPGKRLHGSADLLGPGAASTESAAGRGVE
jgi:hypothetical protein